MREVFWDRIISSSFWPAVATMQMLHIFTWCHFQPTVFFSNLNKDMVRTKQKGYFQRWEHAKKQICNVSISTVRVFSKSSLCQILKTPAVSM
jgi:hypothetical protein